MIGWLITILASGPARKALGWTLPAITIAFAAYSNQWRRAAYSC